MDAARTRFRLSVPNDVSVIGFDDIEQAGWEAYALTTFRQPVEDIARAAVATLAGEMAEAPQRITIPTRLMWRSSIRK